MLGRLDPVLLRPEILAPHAIGGGGFVFVPLLFLDAGVSVVLCAHWVMSAGPAMATHVFGGYPCLFAPKTPAFSAISSAAISSADVSSAAFVLLVCKRF